MLGGVHLTVAHRVPLDALAALAFAGAGIAGALLTAKRPAFGIAFLLVAGPFAWAHDIGPTQLSFPKVVLLGVLLGLAVRRAPLGALRDPRVRPLVGGAFAILAVTALTAIPATYIDATLRETLKAAEYLLAFAAASLAIATAEDEAVVRASVLAGCALVCATALAQYATGAPSGALIDGRVIPRIAGALEGPNQLAGYLDLAIPVLLAGALGRDRLRAATWSVLAVAIATDVLTLSRSGLLGAAAGIAVVLAFRARGTALALWLAAAAAVLFALVAVLGSRFGFLQRFLSLGEVQRENGLGTRAELWRAAIALSKTDPALGIGAGNFELLLPAAGLVGVRTHANSVYLQSLAEGGLALFFALLWTIVSAIALCLRAAPRSALLLGIGAATFGFAVHQVFDVLTFFPKVGGFWWLLLGAGTGRLHALEERAA